MEVQTELVAEGLFIETQVVCVATELEQCPVQVAVIAGEHSPAHFHVAVED
jgi:hypothetical protein